MNFVNKWSNAKCKRNYVYLRVLKYSVKAVNMSHEIRVKFKSFKLIN